VIAFPKSFPFHLSNKNFKHEGEQKKKIKVVVRELVRLTVNKNAHSKVDLMVTKYTYG